MRRPVRQHLGHRTLEARGNIRRRPHRQRTRSVPHNLLRDRRLQPGEAEVTAGPPQQRPRERIPPRVALHRQLLERRPTRPAQAQQLGHLVERLADRIVHRAAQPHMVPDTFHRDALAVSARDQQQQVWKLRPSLHQPRQARGQRVRLQVIHRHIGQRHARWRSPWRTGCRRSDRRSGPARRSPPPRPDRRSPRRRAPSRAAPARARTSDGPARQSPAPRRHRAHARLPGSAQPRPARARSHRAPPPPSRRRTSRCPAPDPFAPTPSFHGQAGAKSNRTHP